MTYANLICRGRLAAVFACLLLLCSSRAFADVRLEGAWPDAQQPVSLDAKRLPRSEAVRRLADAMNWSVVLHAPASDPVDLHVIDQPAAHVLSMLLSDHDYVARREGALISIEPVAATAPVASATTPPVPSLSASIPLSSASAAAKVNPPDRVVTGGNVRVETHEVVHDVVVFGGSADIHGTATGDVTVVGGSARVHERAHVMGDATAVGGSLTVDDGATVDGDVGVVGGTLRRGEHAQIGGSQRTELTAGTEAQARQNQGPVAWIRDAAADVGSAIATAALLFVFGAILLALSTRRMDALQLELASRPMRTFVLGVVGLVVFTLLVIVFTLTIIGIPVAVIGVLIAIVAAYAGICAVLTVAGGALLRHKTRNPYVHLALGCLLFLVAKAIPFLGTFVFLTVLLLGIGSMVATRGAGVFGRKRARA